MSAKQELRDYLRDFNWSRNASRAPLSSSSSDVYHELVKSAARVNTEPSEESITSLEDHIATAHILGVFADDQYQTISEIVNKIRSEEGA